MDQQDKFIKILIIIIIVLFIFLGLKITGVIKTDKKNEQTTSQETIENKNEQTTSQESVENKNEILKEKPEKLYDDSDKIAKKYTTYIVGFSTIMIFLEIIYIVCVIGTYKLYKKIGISKTLNIINLIDSLGLAALINIIRITFIFTSSIFLLIACAIIVLGIPIIIKISYYNKTGTMNSTVWMIFILTILLWPIPIINTIMQITCSITFTIIERISAFKLTKIFNKGTGYKILAILLPEILIVILGFQKNNFKARSTYIEE